MKSVRTGLKIKSFRDFFKIPHGTELRNLLRRLVILLTEQPAIGYDVLRRFQDIIDELVDEYTTKKSILSKNQFIAIVGDMMISEELVKEIAKEFGFSKSNLKFFSDYKFSSDEFDAIASSNCTAIIMGPVPHKTVGDFQKVFEQKIIKALTKSKQLKISKESIYEAFYRVQEKILK
jgi:hypothetical protein